MSSNITLGTNVTAPISLYPSLRIPDTDDQSPFEQNFELSLNSDSKKQRELFLKAWESLVVLQLSYIEAKLPTVTRRQFQNIRIETYNSTVNALVSYVYTLYKNDFGTPKSGKKLLTPEHIAESKQTLRANLIELNGKHSLFDNLLSELQILEAKNTEFSSKVIFILHREAFTNEVKYKLKVAQLEGKVAGVDAQVERRVEALIQEERDKLIEEQLKVESLNNVIDQLNAEKTVLNEELGHLTLALQKANKNIDELVQNSEKDSNEASSETTKLRQLLDKANSRISELKSENEELNNQNDESLKTQSELELKNKKLKDLLTQEEQNYQGLLNELNSTNKALDKLQTEKALKPLLPLTDRTSDTLIIELNTKLRELKSKTDKLEEENRDLRDRYFNTRSELETTRTDLGQEITKNKANQEIIQELKTELTNRTLDPSVLDTNRDPDKSLFGEFSYVDDDEIVTNFNNTVTNLNKRIEEETLRADNLERQLVQYQLNMPGNGDETLTPAQQLQPIVKGLSRLFTKEDKLAIPTFSGKDSDPLVTAWLREAETLATLNKWDEEEKIRYFSQRLRGEAAEWLEEFMRENEEGDYEFWKDSIIERFQNESDIDQLKNTLQNLTQAPGQRTKSFISRLNSLFDDVYGRERQLGDQANQETKDLSDDVKKIRDDQKKTILIKGLLKKIRDEVWPRLPKDANYNELCDAALTAESIVINKEINGEKQLSVAAITTQKELSNELAHKETENELLRQQVALLMAQNKNGTDSQETKKQDTTVAVVSSHSRDSRPSRRNSQVRFSGDRSKSRDNSYSQTRHQGTGYSNPNSRDPSRDRYHRSERNPNRSQFNNRPSRNTQPYQSNQFHSNISPSFLNTQFVAPPIPNLHPPQWNNQYFIPDRFPSNAQPNNYQPQQSRYTNGRENNYYKGQGNQTNNWTKQEQQGQRPTNIYRDKECYVCKKKGHIARQCYYREQDQLLTR